MPRHLSPQLRAVLQALFVTFLWSTSWVLIKIGLQSIPALSFAGVRYGLAFACLLPLLARPAYLGSLKNLKPRGWVHLILLGLLLYAATQGAQFVGLAYLPALTVSLLLNFTTVVVVLLGVVLLAEWPTRVQWVGIGLNLIGIVLYFFPVALPAGQAFGLSAVLLGVLANALAAVLGRHVNRRGEVPALAVTAASMGVGAAALLATGLATQGLPRLTPFHWAIIGWLAVINTALAFTLWNQTLRTLTAMQSNIINSTMLVQVALLAWLFLGERLSWRQGAGMVVAGAGALLAQLRQPRRDNAAIVPYTGRSRG